MMTNVSVDVLYYCAVIMATSVSYIGKMESFTSCKILTLEQIVPKFVTVDYVHESIPQAKFGTKNIYGDFWPEHVSGA